MSLAEVLTAGARRAPSTPRLHTAVGCTSFDDFLAKYGLGRSHACQAMAVVKAFPNRSVRDIDAEAG